MSKRPYNPLEKENLAKSIELEILGQSPVPLSGVDDIKGAGIYVIYYSGLFASYATIRSDITSELFERAIYVGKAIPKGGRKGGLSKNSAQGTALRDRLKQHATSVDEAKNLNLLDFWVRHLVVDDIWIPLGENMLIENLQPIWNRAIDGFGNKDPGRRRKTQYRSPWDVLHPGRSFVKKLAESPLTPKVLEERVSDYFAGRPLKKLPKKVEVQIAENVAEAEASADDVEL